MDDRTLIPPLASCRVKRIQIRSRDKWVETDFFVEQGVRYFFAASGKWRDMNHRCDANGYSVGYLNFAKVWLRCRYDSATWFTLIGAIDKSTDTMFVIGDGRRLNNGWIAPRSGELVVFANDINGMYWDNFGSLTLDVWR
ncbi:hypothetical protein [Citrobacter rodentium]|jgi:hypothetical protein|uniref:Uncharacterized protein n=1 Tax=Citrobacter rodentium (strain ICC168) TaxID=637910 RepID=D2TR23_CITRI|nr:hypothetical protein [Citrobacter rodentium]KIQ52248.1 hypothetical protein TA05_05755 [Citrobacter rodentium]CBG91502.1 hypothetical protein ROD_48131 [Citrobacter rodentium ICC168]